MKRKQTILITGATAGIGRECAVLLARGGHRVFATGRNLKALETLRDELAETPPEILTLDVTNEESIRAAKEEVDRRTNGEGIDVLVNNAGYGTFSPLEELPLATLRAQFETNVFGLVAVTNAFLPRMRERRSGKIINISSLVGKISMPFQGAYNATKFALEALSDAQRLELAPFGIRVVLVEPGAIRTNFEETMTKEIPHNKSSAYLPFVDNYAALIERTYASFAAGPRSVARRVERVVNASRPSARYVSPSINVMPVLLKTVAPTFVFDLFIRLSVGLWKKNVR